MDERLRYLFRQYLQNASSRKELEEFFNYIRQAENDKSIRALLRSVYDEIRDTSAASTYVDENGKLVLTETEWHPAPRSGKTLNKRKLLAGIAAGAVILLSAGIWLIPGARYRVPGKTSSPVALAQKSNDHTEYRSIILPDSTQVWLNDGSTLEYPDHFAGNKREVSLHGEAYFDVKHSEKNLFIIHTGDISTTVLGTAFNIKAYPGQKNITVSVSRGKVKVSRGDNTVATLTRGQQVKISSRDNHVIEKNIAVAEVAAWQQGNMVYEDESFEDIISDLERMYHVSIDLSDASEKKLKISTSFSREIGIEQALQILCKLTDTGLKKQNGQYIIQ